MEKPKDPWKKNDRLLTNIQCFQFYLLTILFIQSQNGFLHFAMNGVALMSAILLQEWWGVKKKKKLVIISFAFLSYIYVCIYI